MTKILMTGAGAPGAAGIIHCLKQDKTLKLYVCDANPEANGRFLNKNRFYKVPNAGESSFIPSILDICKKNNIQLIYPLVTAELLLFSEHKKDFEKEGILVLVSELDALHIANNKSRLYEHLYKNGVLTPDFRVVKAGDMQGFEQAFRDLGFPNKSVCMKPSVSNGSRGIRIVDNSISELDLLFNYKPNSLYTTYDNLVQILRGGIFPELLISEVLPFEEYTIDALINQGVVQLLLPRVRSKMNNGISVQGQFIDNEDIMHYCRQILSTLKLNGNIGIQVKKAEDGRFKILEINPRIQGTSVAAMGLGINLPLLAVHQVLGKNIEIPAIRWGVRFSRYYKEVYY